MESMLLHCQHWAFDGGTAPIRQPTPLADASSTASTLIQTYLGMNGGAPALDAAAPTAALAAIVSSTHLV